MMFNLSISDWGQFTILQLYQNTGTASWFVALILFLGERYIFRISFVIRKYSLVIVLCICLCHIWWPSSTPKYLYDALFSNCCVVSRSIFMCLFLLVYLLQMCTWHTYLVQIPFECPQRTILLVLAVLSIFHHSVQRALNHTCIVVCHLSCFFGCSPIGCKGVSMSLLVD